jgi:hypothetical protein
MPSNHDGIIGTITTAIGTDNDASWLLGCCFTLWQGHLKIGG